MRRNMRAMWPPSYFEISRTARLSLLLMLMSIGPARAQFTPDALENAPTLAAAVNVLNASTAQPSTHLLLDAPDVAVPGKIRVRMSSELRGTSTLVLLKGRFQAGPTASAGRAPPPVERKIIGERPAESAPTVWLGSAPFKAGEPAQLELSFDVDKTDSLTLFALAQGRWWFVTKEVKVGQTPNRSAR